MAERGEDELALSSTAGLLPFGAAGALGKSKGTYAITNDKIRNATIKTVIVFFFQSIRIEIGN
ncbi:MAG: hypothetical protein Q7R98_01760 [Candidatus Jorgensenbacteria bacterium]|nr:hypothetical protein [Candidatus Jorgensenbacteria bacterium]